MGKGGKKQVVHPWRRGECHGLIPVIQKSVAEDRPSVWHVGRWAGIGEAGGPSVPARIVQTRLRTKGDDSIYWDMSRRAQSADGPHGGACGEGPAGGTCGLARRSQQGWKTRVEAEAAAFVHEEERAAVASAGGGHELGRGHAPCVVADGGEGEDQRITGAIGDSNAPRRGVDQGFQSHGLGKAGRSAMRAVMSALMRVTM